MLFRSLEGYEVQAVVIPAAAVNAPHGRDRVWFVATNTKCKSEGSDGGTNDETEGNIRRGNEGNVFGTLRSDGNVTDTRCGEWENGVHGEKQKRETTKFGNSYLQFGQFIQFPTQSPICGGDDGIPTELDGITFSKWRNESIKAYGNAIVPQVAYQIFKAIQETI